MGIDDVTFKEKSPTAWNRPSDCAADNSRDLASWFGFTIAWKHTYIDL